MRDDKFHDLRIKTVCQTLPKGLDILSGTSRVAPDLLKTLSLILDTSVSISVVDREDLIPY